MILGYFTLALDSLPTHSYHVWTPRSCSAVLPFPYLSIALRAMNLEMTVLYSFISMISLDMNMIHSKHGSALHREDVGAAACKLWRRHCHAALVRRLICASPQRRSRPEASGVAMTRDFMNHDTES